MHKGIIWAVVGVAVLAGGSYYAFAGKGSTSSGMATSTPAMSLRELASGQAPQACTFTSANDTQGTVYVASGKVRGDFSARVAGRSIMGHLIVRDDTSYVWMDGMSQGFKNSFEATSTTEGAISADERMQYSCKSWSPDENVFTLPSGITFAAIGSAQLKAGAGAMGASCGQCAQIPDANAKAQCLAALHC